MSEHFADRADLVASLPEDDPERRSALEHAGECASCRRALDQSTALMTLIDVARETSDVPASAVERATGAITKALRREARTLALMAATGVLASWGFELSIARKLETDSSAVAASVAVVTIACAVASWNRAGLRAAAVAGAVSGAFAAMMASVPLLAPRVGVKCTALEILAAALPWLLYLRATRPFYRRWQGSAVAAAGALTGHAALHLTCPVPHADAHLFVFHFGGVLLAAALGATATPGVRKAPRGA